MVDNPVLTEEEAKKIQEAMEDIAADMKGLSPEFYVEMSPDLQNAEFLFVHFEGLKSEGLSLKYPVNYEDLLKLMEWVNKCIEVQTSEQTQTTSSLQFPKT